jgi:hypothetical protein
MQNLAQARVIDPILTSVVQGYQHPERVGNALFPPIPVDQSAGKIIEFNKDSFKLYNSARTPGSQTKVIEWGYLGKPYSVENHALDALVPRELQRDANQVPGIDLSRVAVSNTMNSLGLELESQQAALAVLATNYDAGHKVTLAGATKWSAATGTPVTDIETAKEAIRASCGKRPNTLVLSAVAYKACRTNPNVISRFAYSKGDKPITAADLAALFDVKDVVVGDAIVSDQAGTFTDVWGNNAVLAYVAPPAERNQQVPSFGYTYTLRGHPLVEMPYWDAGRKSWVYGVAHERAAVLTGMVSGYLIINPN